jgi:hypothetical protein
MATFPIEPAHSRYLWFIVPVTALLVGVVVMLLVTVRGSRQSRFEVTAESLRLRGDLYGRTIPRTRLQLGLARRVDFDADPDLRPRWKTMGTGLPGYQAGWYRLRGGGKALLYLTDRAKAVYVPTSDGYGLLLSPADPDGFLAALRSGPR